MSIKNPKRSRTFAPGQKPPGHMPIGLVPHTKRGALVLGARVRGAIVRAANVWGRMSGHRLRNSPWMQSLSDGTNGTNIFLCTYFIMERHIPDFIANIFHYSFSVYLFQFSIYNIFSTQHGERQTRWILQYNVSRLSLTFLGRTRCRVECCRVSWRWRSKDAQVRRQDVRPPRSLPTRSSSITIKIRQHHHHHHNYHHYYYRL